MFPVLPVAATEFWMTRWLTTVWLVGLGVAVGLAILGMLVGLFAILAKLKLFLPLQSKPWLGHAVALVLSLGLAAAIWWGLMQSSERAMTDVEQRLTLFATWFFTAIATWALLFCSSSRWIGELSSIAFRGVGAAILTTAAVVASVGLASTFVVEQPIQTLASLPQIFSAGERIYKISVPGAPTDAQESPFTVAAVPYRAELLTSVVIESNRNIMITDSDSVSRFQMRPVRIEARGEVNWNRKSALPPPLPTASGSQMFIQNQEIDPAEVVFRLATSPATPEVKALLISALGVIFAGLLFFLQQGVAPRVSAIALAAAKNEITQPLFLVLNLIGIFLILLFVFLPFHTFGEDIKLLKDCGITIILVLALFQGVWSASSSVSEEIEGRTALTVLSKPVDRRSFLIGKMLGVFWVLALMFVVLGSWELFWVAFKPIYDAKESSQDTPIWQSCHLELVRTVPGLVMAFLHACVLSAFSVALATRLPQLANFAVCFAIYVVGHLTEALVSSAEGGFAILQFVGELIAVIIPDFEHFSMQSAIDVGNRVPMSFLSGALLYGLLYTLLAVLLGLVLFEDRDVA